MSALTVRNLPTHRRPKRVRPGQKKVDMEEHRARVAANVEFNQSQAVYLRFRCETCHGEAFLDPDGKTLYRCSCDKHGGLGQMQIRMVARKRPTKKEVETAGNIRKWAWPQLAPRYRTLLDSVQSQNVPVDNEFLDDPAE